MKSKIRTRIIIIIVVCAVIVGAGFGVYYYQRSSLVAEVTPVSGLRDMWYGNDISSSGLVTNDNSQIVKLPSSSIIKEVFVEEGQEVKKGDKLVELDMEAAEIEREMKALEVANIQNQITISQNEIVKWQNTVPGNPDEPMEEEPTEPSLGDEKKGDAYRYITPTSVAYNLDEADGTQEKPFRFLCTKDAFVTGEALAMFAKNDTYAVLEVHKKNDIEKKLLHSWEIRGSQIAIPEPDTYWSVVEKREVFPLEEQEPTEEDYEDFEVVYTAEEIQSKIRECEEEIRSLSLSKRKAELELRTLDAKSVDGVIVAQMDGVVRNLAEKQSSDSESDYEMSYMEIAGSDGLYVTGALSELLLDQVKVGQEIQVTSWESGTTTQATIQEVYDYPTTDADVYGGDSNPNVSYYPYTAYIEDTSGLRNGEYVDLNMTVMGESNENVTYIPNAYIRSENGKSYVLKEGEDKKLVKAYVKTGRVLYGQSTEIKKGLTDDDKIAFPYGKTAKEGIKTTDEYSDEEVYEEYY